MQMLTRQGRWQEKSCFYVRKDCYSLDQNSHRQLELWNYDVTDKKAAAAQQF